MSLVNKMKMIETQYRPRIYQGRNRGHGDRHENYRSKIRSSSRDRANTIEEEEIITIEVTGPIIELGVDQGMAMEIEDMTGLIIGRFTEETILGRSMVSQDAEIEV